MQSSSSATRGKFRAKRIIEDNRAEQFLHYPMRGAHSFSHYYNAPSDSSLERHRRDPAKISAYNELAVIVDRGGKKEVANHFVNHRGALAFAKELLDDRV